jgi:lysophospholipase L1-like esterase
MLNRYNILKLLIAAMLFLAHSGHALACPDVGRLPDLNCDGKATVVVIGDSLVFGFGDTKNDNRGGYVLRAQQRLPLVNFVNQGFLGLRTLQMISKLRKAFDNPEQSPLASSLIEADLVVLDVGRNDRWLFGLPEATLRNIKRARQIITDNVKNLGYPAPLIVTAVLMYPNRGSQGPWVKELDELILKSGSAEYPADLRFDQVSKRLLSPDNVHPTSKGYDAMANVFIKYLLSTYPEHARDEG